MQIEYVPFVEDKSKNRDELAQGVVGVKCIYVGPMANGLFLESIKQTLYDWLKDDQYMGTVEAYENGRANVYVRQEKFPAAVGFLRYTPEV